MSGTGKKGKAYFKRAGARTYPTNDTDFMIVIRRLERCSEKQLLCDLCPKLPECQREFDHYVNYYRDKRRLVCPPQGMKV